MAMEGREGKEKEGTGRGGSERRRRLSCVGRGMKTCGVLLRGLLRREGEGSYAKYLSSVL